MPRIPNPWYWTQRDLWCVDVDRKRYRLAKGKSARRAAQKSFHELMVSLGRADAPAAEQVTLAELAEAFLEDVAVKVGRGERAAITYEGYVKYLSAAAERLGERRVSELKPHHVSAWLDRSDLQWGPTTRANAITALKALTRWARRQGRIRLDPFGDLQKPTRLRRQAVLTDDQVQAVLKETEGTPFADLVLALWESGCRPSEVTTLTADRVDLEHKLWQVTNKTRRKTGQDYRPIYLTEPLVELSRTMLERHPEGLLFRNARGHAWTRNAQACAWRRVREQLGYGAEATSYALRHRYAITGLARGADPSELAALMGHTNVDMVNKVYGHWYKQEARLREAARKVRPGD